MAAITANTGTNAWNNNGAWVGGVQPTAADDVTIPSGATVTMSNITGLCRSLTLASGGAITMANNLTFITIGDASGGALSISSSSSITSTLGTITLASTSDNGGAGWNVDLGGKTVGTLVFNGIGGKWLVASDINITSGYTASNGIVAMNGYDVYVGASITISTSLEGAGTVFYLARTSTGTCINLNNSTITGKPDFILTNVSSATRTFALASATVGTIDYTLSGSTGGLVLTASGLGPYIETLKMYDASNARTLQLQNGVNITVKNFEVYGASGRAITLSSTVNASLAYLNLVGGSSTTSTDWLATQDIFISLPYTGYLGVNTTVGTNCSGCLASSMVSGMPRIVNGAGNQATGSPANATFSPDVPTTAGNLLLLIIESTGGTTSFVDPTGFTAASSKNPSSSPNVRIYYKIADGSETTVSATHSSGASNILTHIYEINMNGHTMSIGNSSDGQTSGTQATLTMNNAVVSNVPAISLIGLQGNSSLGTATSATQDFIQGRPYGNTTAGNARSLLLLTNSTGTLNPVITWTSTRSVVAQQQIFEFFPSTPTSTGNMFLVF